MPGSIGDMTMRFTPDQVPSVKELLSKKRVKRIEDVMRPLMWPGRLVEILRVRCDGR